MLSRGLKLFWKRSLWTKGTSNVNDFPRLPPLKKHWRNPVICKNHLKPNQSISSGWHLAKTAKLGHRQICGSQKCSRFAICVLIWFAWMWWIWKLIKLMIEKICLFYKCIKYCLHQILDKFQNLKFDLFKHTGQNVQTQIIIIFCLFNYN